VSTPRFARAALFGAVLMFATACGNTAVSSPTPSPTVAATAVPTVAATATPAPTPTPTATPLPEGGGGPIAEAAVTKLQSDPLIAHVEQVGTASAAGQEISFESSSDFDGADFHVVLAISAGAQSTEQEIILIGDEAWARAGATGAMTSVSTVQLAATVEGLYKAVRLVDDPQVLKFVGVETIDGQELQHLTAVGTIPYAPAGGGTGKYDVFDLWVMEDGTPVIARTEFSATDATGLDASGTTDFTFSEWGGPITIEPPAGF
jgi:hypothetical protein